MMALAVLLAWWLGMALLTFRDHRRADRLATAEDVATLRARALAEPRPRRALLERLADHLERRPEDLDEPLLGAYRGASELSFGGPRWMALTRDLIVGAAAVGPFLVGVIRALVALSDASSQASALAPRQALMASNTLFTAPTEILVSAFTEAGWALALLAGGAAFHHWGRSARVQEARFVRALTEATVRIASDVPSAASIRVLPYFTAPTELSRPALATFLAVLAITASWGALTLTSPLRATRGEPLAVDVWPAGRERPVELPPGLTLPITGGGGPVGEVTGTFFLSATELRVGSIALGSLESGALPGEWARGALSRIQTAGGLPDLGRSIVVAADRRVRAVDVRSLLIFIERRIPGTQLDLLLQRTPDGRRQAVLRTGTVLAGAAAASETTIGFRASGAVEVDGRRVDDPQGQLRARLRSAVEAGRPLRLSLEVERPELTWGEVVAWVGAADATCTARAECGLPGLGVELRWVRPPRNGAP